MKPSFYLLITSLIIIVTSCNSPKNSSEASTADSTQAGAAQTGTAQAAPASDTATPLEGTYWKLIELNSKPVTMGQNQTREQHMILQASDSTVKGFGGCNGFGGKYEAKPGDRIKFSKIVSTMIACESLETENAYFKVLEMADNYNLVNDTLVLNKAKMAPLARFKAVYLK